jgi:hypothetical protein
MLIENNIPVLSVHSSPESYNQLTPESVTQCIRILQSEVTQEENKNLIIITGCHNFMQVNINLNAGKKV